MHIIMRETTNILVKNVSVSNQNDPLKARKLKKWKMLNN